MNESGTPVADALDPRLLESRPEAITVALKVWWRGWACCQARDDGGRMIEEIIGAMQRDDQAEIRIASFAFVPGAEFSCLTVMFPNWKVPTGPSFGIVLL